MRRFLSKKILTGEYIFDYRLPYSRPIGFERLKTSEQKMIEALKQRRIDALCITPNVDYIIELKTKADTTAIGELLTYDTLYQNAIKGAKRTKLWLVCNESNPDIEKVAAKHNIHIEVI